MFARTANAVLILVLAVLVSNGSLLLYPSLGATQNNQLLAHQHRQSKRQLTYGREVADRWFVYGREAEWNGSKRHPRFEHPGSRPPWRKRNIRQEGDPPGLGNSLDLLPKNLASHYMLRTPRNHRTYDVPQIECPQAEDGMDRFACPTPDRMGRYRCIDDHVLCDGFIDCPNGEDEDRQDCMFYKTTKAHMDVIADAVLRWARGR